MTCQRRKTTLFVLCSLFLLALFGSLERSYCEEAAAQGPEPIAISRKHEKPRIPDVDRDKVICFALYTTHDGTLKLSAQLYPLQQGESRDVQLSIEQDGSWQEIATQQVDTQHWMTTFRVDHWDDSKAATYRLTHKGGARYEGTVRRNPIDKDEIVVAAFTGNSNQDRSQRDDIVRNVQAQDPDLLFFSGDQSYDHEHHLAAWLLFGRQFGEIIKNYPTVTIPDDHDVGQANLWGQGGKASYAENDAGNDGGYTMPADYVNMVQRAQTSHLPDPYDSTPIDQKITVYYTSLNIGGIDFAILEDRKWKSGPAGLVPQQGPRPDHINDPSYDPQTVDIPEAKLLGKRQLEFLRAWGQDWSDAEMKAVLSQTIFAGGAHIHGKHDQRLHADLDSNGWPQSGRARALSEIRRCFGFHIAGDQHLATVIHHGINNWEDAGYSFCVPSIVNFYGRWWWPLEKPLQHNPQNPLPFSGRFYDGFRNKLTVHAYANPTQSNFNAAGHGIVRFKKSTREITMECWPRHVDVTSPDAQQFPGWPITIQQTDNYARTEIEYLPTLQISGESFPVDQLPLIQLPLVQLPLVQLPLVQLIDEATGELVYTLRMPKKTWRPPAFWRSSYTLRVGEGEHIQQLEGILSTDKPNDTTLRIDGNL